MRSSYISALVLGRPTSGRRLLFLPALCAASAVTSSALAQVPPPPPAAAPTPGDEAPAADPYASDPYAADPYAAPAAESQSPADTPVADPYAETSAAAAAPAAAASGPSDQASDYDRWFRGVTLHRQNTISGSTGLHRVREAGSGSPGMFRFAVFGGFNGMSGFLCTPDQPCFDPVTGFVQGEDSSQRVEALINLSVTPWEFLEVFAGIRNSATSNSNGRPELLQILGDWNVGVKGFLPAKPDRLFYFGGEAELMFLTGTGGVGLDGAATSVALRALSTLDLNNRTSEDDRFPMRFHANLGYFFDNSGAVVQSLEQTPPPNGRGEPIERTERYGLGVSRVDAFEVGIGAEYVNKWVRPFVEWTLDVPVNRQGYVCNIQDAASRGDFCLGEFAAFNTSPSRLTLGARGYPWQKTGLAIEAAVDIGTGATTFFLEEVTPEAPYNVWFALSYAVDTNPIPEIVEVASLSAEPEPNRFALGQVVDTKSGSPIPDALLRYEDAAITGLVADASGAFQTQNLPPGVYTFNVFAEEYRDGTCTVEIPPALATSDPLLDDLGTDGSSPSLVSTSDDPPNQEVSGVVDPYTEPSTGQVDASASASTTGSAEASAGAAAGTPGSPEEEALIAEPYISAEGDIIVPITCELKPLPRIANIAGLLIDASTGGPVPDATLTITDELGRSLELAVDAEGAFEFRNVPFGKVRLMVRAPGFLSTVSSIEIADRKPLEANMVMNRRPETLSVALGDRSIDFSAPVLFVGSTSKVSADSMVVLEELALLLEEHPEVAQFELQVHTSDVGEPAAMRRLSQQRAEEVKSILLHLGVAEHRIIAKGLGADQPLAPNTSEANRAANERVSILITDRR